MLSLAQRICIGWAAAALAWGQTSAQAEFAAAYQALGKKDYDSAVAHFRTGLKEQPANSHALKDLGYTLLKTGEDAAARDEFQAALKLDRNDEQAALEYAFLADETGETIEARQVFERLSKSGSPANRKTAEQALRNIEGRVADGSSEPKVYPAAASDDSDPSAPVRPARLWAFFDSAYRMRADVDYLAQRWSEDGISLLYVASWHNMEADAAADEYMDQLIAACHRHAIVVYAWLELPYVSEKFWTGHPEWREKTGLNQDAQIGWRKLMNLQNAECDRVVTQLVNHLLARFDWDGVNLAELSFESALNPIDPARCTPFDNNVRSEFQEIAEFDPLLLFDSGSPHANEKERATFLQFRTVVESRMQSEWLKNLTAIQNTKPYLDLVLTVRDEHANLIIQTPGKQKIGIDLSAVDLDQSRLLEAVSSAVKEHLAVALYSENAVRRVDLRSIAAVTGQSGELMQAEMAVQTKMRWPGTAAIQSATVSDKEVDVAYQSHARAPVAFEQKVSAIDLDGVPFWKASGAPCSGIMLPAGQHLVTFTTR